MSPQPPAVSSPRRHRPTWQRSFALSVVGLFTWTGILAVPAQALAHPVQQKQVGVRSLSLLEMQQITGRQIEGGGPGGDDNQHATSLSAASGSTFPWEASTGGTNTGNGNKLTQVPITGWIAKGGMPVSFSIAHNSQSTHNSELGQKWTHSFDLFLVPSTGAGGTDQTVHWGDDLEYKFTQNITGSYTPPTGIHDTLVQNTDGTFTLTNSSQTKYHYTTAGYCDTITDRNSNQITISYNTGHFVTAITDSSSRSIALGYDTSNRINSVTDPLSRVWTIAYGTGNNLTSITYPVLGSTYYSESFGYNTAHDITSFTDKPEYVNTNETLFVGADLKLTAF